MAYHSSEGEVSLPRYQAFKVWRITPTLLFKRNFAVDQGQKAGVCRSQTTFTTFYLGETTHKSYDTFSLGPIVAAQMVEYPGQEEFIISDLRECVGECFPFPHSLEAFHTAVPIRVQMIHISLVPSPVLHLSPLLIMAYALGERTVTHYNIFS